MRELKFRAWDIENKKWLKDWSSYKAGGSEQYFVGFNGDLGCHRTIVGLSMPIFDIDDEPNGIILEQYTGLKDKNGKEIYEGDIVEYSWDFCGIKRKNKYAVEWLSGKVEHYPYSVDSGFTLPDSVDGYMVIGNIHENPELLKKEK
jgi:uncharacterized phage protein (TIGR01671 family)